MSFVNTTFRFLKILGLFILILAIAIPLRYGSTNYQYLTIRLLHSGLTLKNSLVPDAARPTLRAEYRAMEDILRMKPVSVKESLEDPVNFVKSVRAAFALHNVIPKPSQCEINNQTFEYDGHAVHTYWVNYPAREFERKSDKLLLYFHGGGYIVGDIQGEFVRSFYQSLYDYSIGYSGFECYLSQLFDRTILHLEYRLCPEHPLPAAVDDAVALYQVLLQNDISPSQIMIMGDSAGGSLAMLAVQALIARQIPVPHGLISLSSYTDLSASGESYKRNRDIDVMLRSNPEDRSKTLGLLTGSNPSGLSPDDPIFSPLFGSFAGFPPMYINFGTAEILEDDSRGVIKKAQEAGVNVTIEEGLHLMHVYPIMFSYYPEARNTLHNIHKWIIAFE